MSIQFNAANPALAGHSATVEMSLHMESEIYSVLQASNDAIKMRNVKELPRGNAVLEIVIDGQSHRQPIRVLSSSPRPNWVAIEDR